MQQRAYPEGEQALRDFFQRPYYEYDPNTGEWAETSGVIYYTLTVSKDGKTYRRVSGKFRCAGTQSLRCRGNLVRWTDCHGNEGRSGQGPTPACVIDKGQWPGKRPACFLVSDAPSPRFL